MGNSILFSTFEVLPASCCLSLGFVDTRRCFGSEKPASSLFSHFCATLHSPLCALAWHSNLLDYPIKTARNEFIEPTIIKKRQ